MSVQQIAGGRYRVEETLGHGGMATVYLARDVELDRPVAIKVLAEHLGGDPAFRERFLREARMAAKLSHPNIVQVFDAGEDGDRPYIVMECVEGSTLAEEVKESGKVAPDRVVDLALQVCGGLEHAHSAGVIHRDVKPQNLLLRDDGTVKIADFGIARAAEATTNITQLGTVLGTAAYLSPEQAAGESVTAAADIYSLGVVLYELLTGRTPYVFENLAELAYKQREEPIRPLREVEPDVPAPLEAVVMRCLARNPEYRPSSAAEVARELAAAAPDPPTQPLPRDRGVVVTDVETRPLTQVEPAGAATPARPTRRTFEFPRAAAPWLALVVLLALVAVIAVLATSGGDNGRGERRDTRRAARPGRAGSDERRPRRAGAESRRLAPRARARLARTRGLVGRSGRALRGGQNLGRARNLGREDQRLDDLRVELRAPAPAKLLDRLLV